MSEPRVAFGGKPLSDPRLGVQLSHWLAEDDALKLKLQRERNEELVVAYIRRMWREADAKTAGV